MSSKVNLFYQEPDPDRWVPFDRYPRKLIRKVVRGKSRPGGQAMVFINLTKGLDKLAIPYRVNDFAFIKKHPEELACIIGKPHVLFERKWSNPVVFGASVFSHPIDYPRLLTEFPVKKVLVPGEWMRKMFEPYYNTLVQAWPVGTDTHYWTPADTEKKIDILIYDKLYWDRDKYCNELLNPVIQFLERLGLKIEVLRYGSYHVEELLNKARAAKAAIVLSAHETQGLAYQQLLATNVPVFAWDRGGYWQDPEYYPHRVQFKEVSSVPYWDDRCGMKFRDWAGFKETFAPFWDDVRAGRFAPREYIMENLTLEKCAQQYVDITRGLAHPGF
jgi:hypothetical protein